MSSDFNFEEYTWPQVREVVTAADPEFAKIVDDWDPEKAYTFIKISYPFGSHILDINKGGFQLPSVNGGTTPLNHPSVPKELQQKIGYSSLPLGIITRGSLEVYHELNDRVFSLAFFSKGFSLGVWEAFGPPAPYSAVAGARSLFMVPKITDTDQHKRLKATFDLRQPIPRNLFEQWRLFVEIAKHSHDPWKADIYFLNKKWLEPKRCDLGWLNFYNYLQAKAWAHTEYARSRSVFEVSWKDFCQMLQTRGERFDPYLIETVRHLIFVGQGIAPAFAAVDGSELHGPTEFIMQAYLKHYGLKHYAPTLMGPTHFGRTFSADIPVYYSFQNPTLLDSIPKIKTFSSAVDDMRNFKTLLEYFVEESLNNSFKFGNHGLRETLRQIKFDYFHSEMHTYGGIQSSAILPEEDSNLLYVPEANEKKAVC